MHLAATPADGDGAKRLDTLAYHGAERRHRDFGCGHNPAGRPWAIPPYVLIAALAVSISVWLLLVQHQFEDTSWSHDEDWSFHGAWLHGSSIITCRVFCAGSRRTLAYTTSITCAVAIPCYRLPDVLRRRENLIQLFKRFSLPSGIAPFRLVQLSPLSHWTNFPPRRWNRSRHHLTRADSWNDAPRTALTHLPCG